MAHAIQYFFRKSRNGKRRLLSKEDTQMTNRHMKTCSILIIFVEVQIKTITRSPTPVRMAIIKIYTNNKR